MIDGIPKNGEANTIVIALQLLFQSYQHTPNYPTNEKFLDSLATLCVNNKANLGKRALELLALFAQSENVSFQKIDENLKRG